MKRTFDFGKIDYNGTGRKVNRVFVEIELKKRKRKEVFSASAEILQANGGTLCYGQCLNELVPFLEDNEKFMEIYHLWLCYHLNDMHPGTEAQEGALKAFRYMAELANAETNYEAEQALLKGIGLLVDNGYRYGSGWLYRPIPKADRESIIKLIEEG